MEARDRAESVEAWHRQIEQDDVGIEFGRFLDGFDAVRRFGNDEDAVVVS